jgi:hypothetical protein
MTWLCVHELPSFSSLFHLLIFQPLMLSDSREELQFLAVLVTKSSSASQYHHYQHRRRRQHNTIFIACGKAA